MQSYIEERVLSAAEYIIEHSATVRSTAKVLKTSKSTVHKDMQNRLRQLNPMMAKEVRAILDKNKAERHIRGGRATHNKYRKQEA